MHTLDIGASINQKNCKNANNTIQEKYMCFPQNQI